MVAKRRDPPCRPTRHRCAFSARRCSTPPPSSPTTCDPARSNRRRWNIRGSSRTCGTATTEHHLRQWAAQLNRQEGQVVKVLAEAAAGYPKVPFEFQRLANPSGVRDYVGRGDEMSPAGREMMASPNRSAQNRLSANVIKGAGVVAAACILVLVAALGTSPTTYVHPVGGHAVKQPGEGGAGVF